MPNQELFVYNTLSRKKEKFVPISPPYVGMYVCGPTVYNFAHLGNVRTFLTFDILYRYLQNCGFKVRYVRNITDVGHLVGDGDSGEDKIGKMAKLEKLEPMEIVQRYTNDFHNTMKIFNILPPSIEPTATAHIVEQIEATQDLINKGLAYEVNGSVYFDINKYNEKGNNYGKLSGRVLEDLMVETRELEGTQEKRNPLDFALWKKANPEHIMQWSSPWGKGFPGWHLECTCMSTKYLGTTFDIHGGGMDLKFPHHECEIAQGTSLNEKEPVRYWMHSNMLTVNGQKMSKSLGNSFLPAELLTGNHPLLEQAYSPMTVRFFMLQAHYRSTLDFSNEALKAAEKGYKKLLNAYIILNKLSQTETIEIDNDTEEKTNKFINDAFDGINDDLNTGIAIANLFNLSGIINSFYTGQKNVNALSTNTFEKLKTTFNAFFNDILGLAEEDTISKKALIDTLLAIYKEAKEAKDYSKVDSIRAALKTQGIAVKDLKTGIDWAYD
jgi:cysteinyl-tRNA synthetase